MNNKYKDSIYEELKGYFPAEYDLTPEELEVEPERKDFSIDTDVTFVSPITNVNPINDNADLFDAIEEDEQASEKSKLHDLYDIVEMFAACVACIILVFSFFARLTVVEGDSMNDTLVDGEYLIISGFMYTPEQGDIVVLQDTTADHPELQKPIIKRIIAVGGQSVDVSKTGVVTVTDKDGETTVIDDGFIKQETYEGRYFGHWDIPEGYVFVMGDNRNHSTDSRDYRLGIIDERCIIGKASLRVLPLNAFSVIDNPLDK